MTRPPFPAVIDSSLIAAFRSCPRKAYLDFFEHWKPRTPSVHLHAGAAFAKGLEIARTSFFHGGRPEAESVAAGGKALIEAYGSFECPPDSAKSLERTLGAYEYYFSVYPLSEDRAVPSTFGDGRRGIEFSFAEPLPITHPETGDPLIYVGRLDQIVDYNGARFGEDDKTTSQLGASWPKQWDLRSQFTGYCWGAQRAGHPLSGFIVRGISILKSKYETMQAITYRPQWMIDEWYEQVVERDIPLMLQMWESGKWGAALDHACAEYGGCGFKQVCLAEPTSRIQWLGTSFERRRWDPVTRTETAL